jgi:hypothetical protein
MSSRNLSTLKIILNSHSSSTTQFGDAAFPCENDMNQNRLDFGNTCFIKLLCRLDI